MLSMLDTTMLNSWDPLPNMVQCPGELIFELDDRTPRVETQFVVVDDLDGEVLKGAAIQARSARGPLRMLGWTSHGFEPYSLYHPAGERFDWEVRLEDYVSATGHSSAAIQVAEGYLQTVRLHRKP